MWWKRTRNGATNAPSAYMLKLCSAPTAITHSIVGIESTRRYGDCRRGGERRRRALRPCRAAARASAARRPRRGCRAPPRCRTRCASPSSAESIRRRRWRGRGRAAGRASRSRRRARARRLGKRSPMSEVDAGEQVASPTPTPRRATISCEKLRARPDARGQQAPDRTRRRRRIVRRSFRVRQPAERQADDAHTAA